MKLDYSSLFSYAKNDWCIISLLIVGMLGEGVLLQQWSAGDVLCFPYRPPPDFPRPPFSPVRRRKMQWTQMARRIHTHTLTTIISMSCAVCAVACNLSPFPSLSALELLQADGRHLLRERAVAV